MSMQTESFTGLEIGLERPSIGQAAKNADAPNACFKNSLRLVIRSRLGRFAGLGVFAETGFRHLAFHAKSQRSAKTLRTPAYERARFKYSNAVRVPSVGSAVSGSYSMLATYLNLIFFSSFIVSTIGVEP